MIALPQAETLSPPYQPHWISRSAFQFVVICLALTEMALAWVLWSGATLWLAVPLVFLASHFMHGAAVGFHEASHGLLRRNRRLNEFDGMLIAVFSFTSFSLYRAAHQSHHAYLSTERDEELWPFVMVDTPRWVRRHAAFMELTMGLLFTPALFLRSFLRSGSPIRSKKVRRRIWKELILMLAVWIVILSSVTYWQMWPYFLWMYAAPEIIAGNMQSWRKYIEHMGMTGSTVNGCTRSIIAKGWFGHVVSLTLLHEPYHGAHHLHVGLPHAELPGRASELEPTQPDEPSPFRSYGHAMLDLMRCLRDPRVGKQWNNIPYQP